MTAQTVEMTEVDTRALDLQNAALYLVWRKPEDSQPASYQVPVSRLNALFEEKITWEDAEWQ